MNIYLTAANGVLFTSIKHVAFKGETKVSSEFPEKCIFSYFSEILCICINRYIWYPKNKDLLISKWFYLEAHKFDLRVFFNCLFF